MKLHKGYLQGWVQSEKRMQQLLTEGKVDCNKCNAKGLDKMAVTGAHGLFESEWTSKCWHCHLGVMTKETVIKESQQSLKQLQEEADKRLDDIVILQNGIKQYKKQLLRLQKQ